MISKRHPFTFRTNIYSYTDDFRQTTPSSVILMGERSSCILARMILRRYKFNNITENNVN
jgi:hypothetical protein